MPIHSGTDKDGSFYQWGSTGKKYHFNPNDKKSRQNALRKAKAQQTAIYSSGWKGDNNMADKMKLIKVKTGDANSREEILKQIDDALKDMHPGMDKISKAIKALRSIDKDVANDKQAVFNKLTFAYYELGSK